MRVSSRVKSDTGNCCERHVWVVRGNDDLQVHRARFDLFGIMYSKGCISLVKLELRIVSIQFHFGCSYFEMICGALAYLL